MDERPVIPNGRQLRHMRALRRELANRVNRRGGPGEHEGLAATAAEVLFMAEAAGARLLHPGGATKGI